MVRLIFFGPQFPIMPCRYMTCKLSDVLLSHFRQPQKFIQLASRNDKINQQQTTRCSSLRPNTPMCFVIRETKLKHRSTCQSKQNDKLNIWRKARSTRISAYIGTEGVTDSNHGIVRKISSSALVQGPTTQILEIGIREMEGLSSIINRHWKETDASENFCTSRQTHKRLYLSH